MAQIVAPDDPRAITFLRRPYACEILSGALEDCAKRSQPTFSEQKEEKKTLGLFLKAISLSEDALWVSRDSDKARDFVNGLMTYVVEIRGIPRPW